MKIILYDSYTKMIFEGFEFDDSKTHCDDLDECKNKNRQTTEMGKCTHLYTNSFGGYEQRV